MSKKNCIFILVLLFLIKSNAQEKTYKQAEVDSLEIEPNTLERQAMFKKILLSDTLLTGWVRYYRRKSHYFLAKNELDSSRFYALKGVKKYNDLDFQVAMEEQNLKDIYFYLAYILTNLDKKYRESTKYLHKAIDISKEYPNSRTATNPYIYGYLASNYLKMGDKKKALQYRLQIAKDSIFMAVPREAGATFNRIGLLYDNEGKKDSAIYYYRKSLKVYLAITNYAGIKGAYNNIGDYFREQKNIDSALYFYKKNIELQDEYPKESYGYGTLFIEANSGFVYIKEGKAKKALAILNKVLDTVRNISKIDDEIIGLHDSTSDYLIEAYQNLNLNKKAIEVVRKKDHFFRKYHLQVLDERLRELNIAYEVREKEESIEQLEAFTEEQETIIRQQNVIAITLLSVLLLIIGIGILLFRQRKLKNKYETANLEQRLLRSQLNPHFVFNALNIVSNLVRKNSENTLTYIAKLSSLIRLILKNSRKEFISLENELQSVEDYLGLQSNFSQKFTYEILVPDAIDVEGTYIPPMFIQPFIENSIAHGLRGVTDGSIKVELSINQKDRLIECRILDNGIGFIKASQYKAKNNQEHQSFSGKIIKERLQIYAKSLNKKTSYTVNEVFEGKGTEVTVLLPYVMDA